MINKSFEDTRRNAFIPIITYTIALIIIRVANQFRIIVEYHFVYFWGYLIGYFLILLCIIFSVINGIFLLKMFIIDSQKYDMFLLLLNYLPVLYFIYITILTFI